MGDQTEKMGLEKSADSLDKAAHINNAPITDDKQPNNNDVVDQILFDNNLGVAATTDEDLTQNVDEIMQVIKSIENNPSNDLGVEDLPANLTIEKFLKDVDMMNMSMEDPQV